MSPILFLFIIHALLDTLKFDAQPIQFSHFPENKNGNLKMCKSRLLSQKSTAKGLPFIFQTSFFVDDSFFLFQNRQELKEAIAHLNSHFAIWTDYAPRRREYKVKIRVTTTPLLNEDFEVEARIRKAKSIMGASRHFFDNKDVDRRVKKEIYIAGWQNDLLWGCESWNLMEKTSTN
jgi:hypothetical protein